MEFINQALSWIADFLSSCLLAVATPFINLLPLHDAYSPDFIGYAFGNSTFNVAALFDWTMLTWGFAILGNVMLICPYPCAS